MTGMTGTGEYTAEHEETTHASAARAYGLIADVTLWPLLFAPCLHIDLLEQGPRDERFRMWVLAGGDVRSWISRRRLDPEDHHAGFRQENPTAPFSSVSGDWRFEPAADGTRIVLAHQWDLIAPDPDVEKWVAQALDRNSTLEVGAVRFWAERPEDLGDLVFSFTDEVVLDSPADRVYDFLYRADLWPRRIPHVARVGLETAAATEATAGAQVQTMDMDTEAPDGTRHTTRSLRLCFEGRRIVYKQTAPPRPLLAHSGSWTVVAEGDRTRVLARHDVALDPEAIEAVLGAGTTAAQAQGSVRAALRTNSLRTLEQAGGHAAGRPPLG